MDGDESQDLRLAKGFDFSGGAGPPLGPGLREALGRALRLHPLRGRLRPGTRKKAGELGERPRRFGKFGGLGGTGAVGFFGGTPEKA